MKPIQLTPDQAIGGLNRPTFPIDMYTFATGMGWFTDAYRGNRTNSLRSEMFLNYVWNDLVKDAEQRTDIQS